jgi:hypothetical protein
MKINLSIMDRLIFNKLLTLKELESYSFEQRLTLVSVYHNDFKRIALKKGIHISAVVAQFIQK